MKSTDDKKDLVAFSEGVTKSLLSRIPIIKETLANYDAYKQNVFRRNVSSFMEYLNNKIDDIDDIIRNDWIKTKEGEQFVRKVVDAALDEQLQDKQEFFVNAMINGVNNQTIAQLEKLKFIDILRQLSRAAILVLLEIHNIFKNRQDQSIINKEFIARKLSYKYNPYLTISAISEMESAGIFSSTTGWHKTPEGGYESTSYTPSGVNYTEFTTKFIEFISELLRKIVA